MFLAPLLGSIDAEALSLFPPLFDNGLRLSHCPLRCSIIELSSKGMCVAYQPSEPIASPLTWPQSF